MDNLDHRYTAVSIKTADNLKTIAESVSVSGISPLSLPQIEAVVDQVARMIPAGNVPGMILSGLARLSGRKVSPKSVKRDVNLLFKGVGQTLDAALYGTFFAGPAAIIWGYQQLLKLSGKDPDDAFPEGAWQFYVDYAMREDTARHANETHGFDTLLNRQQIRLPAVDRITAWVMAAINCLHHYDALLANEWRERIYTHHLAELSVNKPEAARYSQLYQEWEKLRPYGRKADALAEESYAAYRLRKFNQFLADAMLDLPPELRAQWAKQVSAAERHNLPAYQQQMSILTYLEPGAYGETRTPIPLEETKIGIVYRDGYYLIPTCTPGTVRPTDVQTVRGIVATMLAGRSNQGTPLANLAEVKRESWPDLRRKFSEELLSNLDRLRLAPILLNFDARPSRLPLSELRHHERGVGDHALTLFDTGNSMVFDQSHIFFDGAWGAAISEILTQEAQWWTVHLEPMDEPPQGGRRSPERLSFNIRSSEMDLIRRAPQITPEVSAETENINLKAIVKLRQLFKRRSDLLRLTVNDLLVLYRAIHAATYQPDPALDFKLKTLAHEGGASGAAGRAAIEALLEANKLNPAIAMPVDASRHAPGDRLQPITLEIPLADLDLLSLHEQTMAAWSSYEQLIGDGAAVNAEFDRLQRLYLANLAGIGVVLNKTKEIAGKGESLSVGAIKLLAQVPAPLQHMVEKVPNSFDMLNDIIRGREVFSNVGKVAPGSTLTRFISAKDDSDKKTLVWAVMTDVNDVMRISLRDFRPHVAKLIAVGHRDLALHMTRHYLSTYAQGFNNFIGDLRRITESGPKK